MPETQEKKAVYSLAFNVYAHGDNMFSARMLKLKDSKVTEWKHGVATSLGHAIASAENLMSAYALYEHETPAEKFYEEATIV